MKLETIITNSKEIFIDAPTALVTVNLWSNRDGACIQVHGKNGGLPLKMAGALRWEDIDALMIALSAARAA